MSRLGAPRPPRAAEGRRAGVGIAASTAFHLLVLAALVLTLRKPPPASLEPAMEVTLIRPSALPAPARPRPAPAPKPSIRFRPVPTTEPAPAAPISPERAQPQDRPPPVAIPARPPGDMIQFYQQHIPGCGREDLVLMTAEEQEACRARIAAAAAARRNLQAEDRRRAPLMAIDPAKRVEYEAALRSRRDKRDGAKGAALLADIYRDRKGGGLNTNVDVNGKIECTAKFSLGGDGVKLGGTRC